MEGSFMAASFQPPADDDAKPSRYPSWVLLDNRAYFADRDNATTVKAKASTGYEVKVTFCLAEPPAVSYFCVHCPKIRIEDCCTTEPRVVSSANDLALLCFVFGTDPSSTDKDSHHFQHFVYKAASGGQHSISPVPCSPPAYRHSWHAAILPREDDNFLVADLSLNGRLGHYNLHFFSSETNVWSTTQLQLKTPPDVLPRDLPCQTDKVISLGGSMVGWVDLWRGIVVCDVLEKEPVLRFIPLPKADFDLDPKREARPVRDVTGCHDGFINFIEIEHCSKWLNFINMRSFKTTRFLDFLDTIHDIELLSYDEMDFMEDERKSVPDGWKIRTCFRSISSDHWRKRHTVHVDDISGDPQHSVLLPQLWDSRTETCILRNLKTTGFPTFGVCGSNVIYLMSEVGKLENGDKDAWIVCVDLGKKTLEVIKPYCASRATYFDPTFISCAFSQYLNTTPRPYVDEVAVDCAQTGASNDHLLLSNTIPTADTAQTGVPNNMQTQQNTWNGDGYYGSLNEYRYGAHPACGNYQQPTPLQPLFILPPSLTQIAAHVIFNSIRRVYLCPLDGARRLWPCPWPPINASNASAATLGPQPLAPRQSFAPPMTSTAVLNHGQQHHMKPFSSLTHREQVEYHD